MSNCPSCSSVVFITGASSGFGEACAHAFASPNTKLVLAARRTDRLEALQKSLPCPSHLVTLDVRDKDAVFHAVENLPQDFADVDVLINNAGLALGLGSAQTADLDDWQTMIDTNCTGLVLCTRAILPGMVKRNRGHIVNVGSIAGNWPYPGGNVYCATKAFVHQFSLALRADLLGTAVRVTCIEPGMAETEFSKVRFHGDIEQARKCYEGLTPLSAQDIAETILWTVSRPAHVNINTLELMPVSQAFGPLAVKRS